jgi:hypothetical protein
VGGTPAQSFALCSSATALFNFHFAATKVHLATISANVGVKDSGREDVHAEPSST